MEEQKKDLPEAEESIPAKEDQPVKTPWQLTKESWYDKVPLTLKQLDIIIGCGIAGMIILAIVIGLDAAGVF